MPTGDPFCYGCNSFPCRCNTAGVGATYIPITYPWPNNAAAGYSYTITGNRLSDEDVERIAKRVVELLKEKNATP